MALWLAMRVAIYVQYTTSAFRNVLHYMTYNTDEETIKKLENIVNDHCEFIKVILVKHHKYSTSSYQET